MLQKEFLIEDDTIHDKVQDDKKNKMKKLNELTLIEALTGLKKGNFSSVDLVNACYDSINKHNNKVQAFITIIPREKSLELAKAVDRLILSDGTEAFERKPLLGIPYSCKDVYNTIGIQTTAGSNILKGYIPPYESTVTRKLKDAGAILIAKDNQDAFGHGGSTEQSDFFTTKNPWDTSRLPGGSSGGTAAAVVSNFVIFGIGEDTGGSIRCPASWCGVTGLKPTYGRVSRYGVIAMASSTDCPGPICKSVEDIAIVMEIISGQDELDSATVNVPVEKYFSNIEQFGVKNMKVGIAKSFFSEAMEPGVVERVNRATEIYKNLGAQIVEVDVLDPKYALAVYTIVQRSEVSSNLARFDGIRFGHSRGNFGFEAKKRMMLGAYVLSAGYYDAYYSKAQKVRTKIIENFNEVFKKVDVLLAPTLPGVAQKIGASSESPFFGELIDTLQLPASMSGIPSLALPCGFSENLPVGMQMMGPQFSEAKILQVGYAFQQATDFHKKFPSLE